MIWRRILIYLSDCRSHAFLSLMDVCNCKPSLKTRWRLDESCLIYSSCAILSPIFFFSDYSYVGFEVTLRPFVIFSSRCVGNIREATVLGGRMTAASPTPQTAPWSTPTTTPSPCAWTTSRAAAPGKSASTSTRRPTCRPKSRLPSTRWTRPQPPRPWWAIRNERRSHSFAPTRQAKRSNYGEAIVQQEIQ